MLRTTDYFKTGHNNTKTLLMINLKASKDKAQLIYSTASLTVYFTSLLISN